MADTKVGFTLEGTADLTVYEVHALVDYFQALARHMNDPLKYRKPLLEDMDY